MSRQVTHEDGYLRVSFDYDPSLVQLVKGIPGRKYHNLGPQGRYWTVPPTQVVQVVELLEPFGFEFDHATTELYERHKGSHKDHYTVSRLNAEARAALAKAFPSPVWLVGEITGFSKSAHKPIVDFQLVDRDEGGQVLAQVGAVLFQRERQAIEAKLSREGDPVRLEDEVAVRLQVQVELHSEWGTYRVVVQDLDVAYTLGEAARRREEILRTLTEEGLAERNRKLPFPSFPLRVGLITSEGSDAERDVLNTLQQSGYAFQVAVYGVRVQGRQTEPTVLAALEWFASRAQEFDVVLVCRGGGSRTDLGWFDSLALGRAVARFPLPVVIGIGHEKDRSVLDEVGWRANTPTAAAQLLQVRVKETLERAHRSCARALELAAAQITTEEDRTVSQAQRLVRAVSYAIDRSQRVLQEFRRRLVQSTTSVVRTERHELRTRADGLPRATGYLLGAERTRLQEARRRLRHASLHHVSREQERTQARTRRLDLVHPRRVLERGYALLRSGAGKVITEAGQAPPGDHLIAELRKGRLRLRSEGPHAEREGEQ